MTIKPRAARALRDVRTRLRDATAAEHAVANANKERAAERVASEYDRLEDTLDDAIPTLARASSVHELDRYADLVTEQRHAIAAASGRHAEAIAATEQSAVRLRDSARKLRTAERIVEQLDGDRTERELRAEQRGSDDLAGRRR